MAHWSVEEQNIVIPEDVTIKTINMRVDHNDTSIMLMELGSPPDTHVLRFNRNGVYLSHELVKAAPPAAPPEEDEEPKHASSHSTTRRR